MPDITNYFDNNPNTDKRKQPDGRKSIMTPPHEQIFPENRDRQSSPIKKQKTVLFCW